MLHLREEEKDFANTHRIRTIVKKYSDHIAIPVMMEKIDMPSPETDEDKKEEGLSIDYSKICCMYFVAPMG